MMAASKSLGSGDWTNAYAHLAALPVWALVPGREQVLPHTIPSAGVILRAMASLCHAAGCGASDSHCLAPDTLASVCCKPEHAASSPACPISMHASAGF